MFIFTVQLQRKMTKEELLNRLSDIEWEDFEIKRASDELPKTIWDTVGAFSNSAGGWIVLGVSQQGKKFELTGIANPEKITEYKSHNRYLQIGVFS